MRFSVFPAAIFVLLAGRACGVHAGDLPQWCIEDEVFRAELVVIVSLAENHKVRVGEVLMGSATVGQKLQVERLLDLSRRKFDDKEKASNYMWKREAGKSAYAKGLEINNIYKFDVWHSRPRLWFPSVHSRRRLCHIPEIV